MSHSVLAVGVVSGEYRRQRVLDNLLPGVAHGSAQLRHTPFLAETIVYYLFSKAIMENKSVPFYHLSRDRRYTDGNTSRCAIERVYGYQTVLLPYSVPTQMHPLLSADSFYYGSFVQGSSLQGSTNTALAYTLPALQRNL